MAEIWDIARTSSDIQGRRCLKECILVYYSPSFRGHLRTMSTYPDMKDIKESSIEPSNQEVAPGKHENTTVSEEYEIFKRGHGQVDFRTVSWIRASVIFLKGKLYLPTTQ